MKELYIEEYDRLVGDYVEAGLSEDEAERRADVEAYDAMTDRLADLADRYRDAVREAGQ